MERSGFHLMHTQIDYSGIWISEGLIKLNERMATILWLSCSGGGGGGGGGLYTQ